MKVKKKISIILLLLSVILFAIYFFVKFQNNYSVIVCKWKGDKTGAISVSFDDASYVQYQYAVPILEEMGFKASFGVVGVWTHENPSYSAEPGIFEINKMGWNEIRELHRKGNEICAHGYKHERYNQDANIDSLVFQMKKIKTLIEKNIGDECITLHYPYSHTSDKITNAAKKAGFLFARSGEEEINSSSPNNMQLLVSKAIYNNDTPNHEEIKSILDETKGKWLILMYHHLFPDDSKEMNILRYHKIKNTYSLLPSTFKSQMQLINNYNYWVAPISTIGKYIEERDNLNIETHRFLNKIDIKTNTSLDTSIFNEKITLKIELPWEKVEVTKDKMTHFQNIKNGNFLIDIIPGESLMIKKSK